MDVRSLGALSLGCLAALALGSCSSASSTGDDADAASASDAPASDASDAEETASDAAADRDGDAGCALPAGCDDVIDAVQSLVASGRSCSASGPSCVVTTTPLPAGFPFCAPIALNDQADTSKLASLGAQWSSLGCEAAWSAAEKLGCPKHGGACMSLPVPAYPICNPDGCGATTQSPACRACPSGGAPVCTTDGQTAANDCVAVQCLGAKVAYDGVCQNPTCTGLGGTCVIAQGPGPLCPDGTKYGNPSCGDIDISCCVPSGLSCTWVASTLNLDVDPFTCAPAPKPAAGNTCLYPPHTITACAASGWTFGLPMQPSATAKVTLTAAAKGAVSVAGTDTATGRTFTCSGTAQLDPNAGATTWTCRACHGTACTNCQVQETPGCVP